MSPQAASRRPNPMPVFHRCLSNLIQTPILGIVTGICGSLALFVSLFEKSGRLQHRIAQTWARLLIPITGAKLTVRGAENLLKCRVAVYASNHTSYIDTPVIFSSLPFQFRILARKELWSIAFIGWYLNRSGQIPVDTTHGSLNSLGAGVKALKTGMPVFVFPEGGRTKTGELQAFQMGAAYLAIRAQVPLVPIALGGLYDLLPIHTHAFYPGRVTLAIGEPIETSGMHIRQVEELTDRLKAAIASLLDQNTLSS